MITPEDLEIIGRMKAHGQSTYAIAEHFGVARSTIQGHLDRHWKPIWEEERARSAAQIWAEIDEVKRNNWTAVEAGVRGDLADVRWAIEQQAKLGGHYAPDRVIQVEEPGRVAGKTPVDLLSELIASLSREADDILARTTG